MILAALVLSQSSFRIGCAMKEGDAWRFDTVEVLKAEGLYLRDEERCIQRVLEIDDRGVQHIEVECIGGTIESTLNGEKQEVEDPKGNTWNFLLNGNGQVFQYEEIKSTFDDDPLGFMDDLLHAPIDRPSVVPGESWRRKTKIMDVNFKVLPVKKVDNYSCVGLERTGTFLDPFQGTFKVTQWYRCETGRMQSENTIADDVQSKDLPLLDYTFTYSAKEK